MSRRVYYHETRDVCEGLPALLHRFPIRALLSARPGDQVVVPNGFGVPPELDLLNRLGFGPSPKDVIYVDPDGSIVKNKVALNTGEVWPFSGTTTRGRMFAERYKRTLKAPGLDACVEANSKSAFQEIVNRLVAENRLKAPDGRVAIGEDRISTIQALLNCYGHVIAKGTHSSSGLQQKEFRVGDEITLQGLPEEIVIQEWLAGKASPSVNLDIRFDGTVRYLFETEQILEGTHHVGNRYLGSPMTLLSHNMCESAIVIGQELWKNGYWGPCGIDFMVTEKEEAYAIEANARITAPWYPWIATKRRFGFPLPFVMRSAKIRKDTTIQDIENALGEQIFNEPSKCGAVPFCFLPEHEFVYIVVFAKKPEHLSVLYADVMEQMSGLR